MPSELTKKQPVITSFTRRLHAACRVYYTNKLDWIVIFYLVFLPLCFIAFSTPNTSNRYENTQLEIGKHPFSIEDTLKPDDSETKQFRFENRQDELKFQKFSENQIERAIKHQRGRMTFSLSIPFVLLVIGGGVFLPSRIKYQFSSPRSVTLPGFVLPHLVAGIGGIILLTLFGAGFAWYRTEASFFSCFSLLMFGSGYLIQAGRKTGGLWFLIHSLIPLTYVLLTVIQAPLIAHNMKGEYPIISLGLGLIGLVFITMFARRLMHFDEEQPEYSSLYPILNMKELFTQPDLKKQEARLKPFLKKQSWHLKTMDWLSQYFHRRALRENKLNRTLLWQVLRGGQAVICMGFAIAFMLLSGLVLLITEKYIRHLDGIFQLGDAGIPLVLVVPLSGLLLIILVMTWVQTRPQLQIELMRPMDRVDFVQSLIRTHLLEALMVAVPVFVGNVILTLMFHSDMHYILISIILMFSITLLLIGAVPWVISFRSRAPVFFMIVIGQVMIMVLVSKSLYLNQIIFSFWAQGLFLMSVLIAGMLLLLDTRRRWMKTEFGR